MYVVIYTPYRRNPLYFNSLPGGVWQGAPMWFQFIMGDCTLLKAVRCNLSNDSLLSDRTKGKGTVVAYSDVTERMLPKALVVALCAAARGWAAWLENLSQALNLQNDDVIILSPDDWLVGMNIEPGGQGGKDNFPAPGSKAAKGFETIGEAKARLCRKGLPVGIGDLRATWLRIGEKGDFTEPFIPGVTVRLKGSARERLLAEQNALLLAKIAAVEAKLAESAKADTPTTDKPTTDKPTTDKPANNTNKRK